LKRLRILVDQYGRKQEVSARNWRAAYIAIGLPATALAAAAGVSGLADFGTGWTVALALAAAALTALSGALNPGKHWEATRLTAERCESLTREIDVVSNVDLGNYEPAEQREVLESLMIKLDQTVGANDYQSFWSQWRERRHGR
jgi:hypothetical protein